MIKSFKLFLIEDFDRDNDKMWSELDPHDRKLKGPVKDAVDSYVGVSHKDIDDYNQNKPLRRDFGLSTPFELERKRSEVHSANEGLRDVIKKHHGDTITAYRGIVDCEDRVPGNRISSWTTDPSLAHSYATGGDEHKHEKSFDDCIRDKSVLKRDINVDDIVHATNRLKQHELIVRNQPKYGLKSDNSAL